MSITCSVQRASRSIVVSVLVVFSLLFAGVVHLDGGTPAGAAPVSPSAPAAPGANDPAARVATLGALVARRSTTVDSATARRDNVRSRLDLARTQEEAARARTSELAEIEIRAAARFERSQARVARFAAAAYRDGPSITPLTQLFSSHSAGDYAYRHEIVRRIGAQQRALVKDAKRTRIAAAAAEEEARAERDRLADVVASLERDLPAREQALTAAVTSRDQARFWLARWEAVQAGPATPILGPARLSADELTKWFTGTRHHARTTVPIAELAGIYIEEGASAGVRSDIAFAQSMLETGGFSYPAGGQVLGTDNNFAGMGACDSCATGNRFPDARTGVRAQMQQLRVYADANLKNASLNPPAVNPKLDTHFLKGKVTTWAGLTGTWATAKTYGVRILEIYDQILGWLTDRADI